MKRWLRDVRQLIMGQRLFPISRDLMQTLMIRLDWKTMNNLRVVSLVRGIHIRIITLIILQDVPPEVVQPPARVPQLRRDGRVYRATTVIYTNQFPHKVSRRMRRVNYNVKPVPVGREMMTPHLNMGRSRQIGVICQVVPWGTMIQGGISIRLSVFMADKN